MGGGECLQPSRCFQLTFQNGLSLSLFSLAAAGRQAGRREGSRERERLWSTLGRRALVGLQGAPTLGP